MKPRTLRLTGAIFFVGGVVTVLLGFEQFACGLVLGLLIAVLMLWRVYRAARTGGTDTAE